MSIRAQAAADMQSILNADFDSVTLTAPDEDPVTVKGKVTRVDSYIDSEGIKIDEPATRVSVSLLDLDGIPNEEWRVQTTDTLGNALDGQAMSVEVSRTIGFVRFYLEVVN